jgi:CubicO group peptidase (beta-lactamase class C family)
MALNRYVLTAKVTLPSGAFTLGGSDVIIDQAGAGGGFGTGSYAQAAGEYGSGAGATAGSTTWYPGQVIWADPAGALYAAIGSANLRAFVDGQDNVGHWGLSN